MTEIEQILWRNQGNVLSPEMIHGLLAGLNYALDMHPSPIPMVGAAEPVVEGHRLITDDRWRVGAWVAERVGQQVEWGGFAAIGQEGPDGNLNVGMVLNHITPSNASMHVAIADGSRMTREVVRACFDYVFNQLGLARVTGYVDADNAAALRFDKHLGFEEEFIIKQGNVGDVLQLVMFKEKCRWIK